LSAAKGERIFSSRSSSCFLIDLPTTGTKDIVFSLAHPAQGAYLSPPRGIIGYGIIF
jgi:hypothetical protein